MEKQSRSLALYKVQANGWNDGEYAAADNHLAAIDNVAAEYQDLEPQTCSVSYLGRVWLFPRDTMSEQTVATLREENERLKHGQGYKWTDKDRVMADEIISFFEHGGSNLQREFEIYANWLTNIRDVSV